MYKVLTEDRRPIHGGQGVWTPGKWRSVQGQLIPCQHGLHLCRLEHLIGWLGPAIWTAETDGEVLDAGDKIVARKARILDRVEAWNEVTARLFAADCAERVLPIFEAARPGDGRPAEAVRVARLFARGECSAEVLNDAWAAAWAAVRDAAWDAAWSAAGAAAGAAARPAAWDVAWDAGAAGAAAGFAGAADGAARAAAGAAAGAVAWAAEQDWQTQRLHQYLTGEAT